MEVFQYTAFLLLMCIQLIMCLDVRRLEWGRTLDHHIDRGPSWVFTEHTKEWLSYIMRELSSSISSGHVSLRFMLLQLNTKQLLYDACSTPRHTLFHALPCGVISYTFNNFHHKICEWEITVNPVLMINITIDKAYVPYSDTCGRKYVATYDGNSTVDKHRLGRFCGHVLFESVYTRWNRGLIYMVVHAADAWDMVYINATYQVHTQGIAYRFNGLWFNQHSSNITTPHAPLWVYFCSHMLDYIWYYLLQTGSKIASITVNKLECNNSTTFVELRSGLLPHVWLNERAGHRRYCNLPSWTASTVDYRFATILLRTNPVDATLQFSFSFKVIQIRNAVMRDGYISEQLCIICHQRVQFAHMKVVNFSYNGYKRNIQHSHVYVPGGGARY